MFFDVLLILNVERYLQNFKTKQASLLWSQNLEQLFHQGLLNLANRIQESRLHYETSYISNNYKSLLLRKIL